MSSAGLPRQVLKWIQSLDLTYSVKNVRRDFANGFLIAEILSRHLKKDEIALHSFDNGASLKKKQDNWALLARVFHKRGVRVTDDEIQAIIHAKKGSARALLERLYTFLTNRKLRAPAPVQDRQIVPAFARPTASKRIKDRLNEPDIKQSDSVSSLVSKTESVLLGHNRELAADRQPLPTRFSPTRTQAMLRVQTRRVGRDQKEAGASTAPEQRIQFAAVQVQQVSAHDQVAQLRAARAGQRAYVPDPAAGSAPGSGGGGGSGQHSEAGSLMGSPGSARSLAGLSPGLGGSLSSALGSGGGGGGGGGKGVVKPALDLMNACVLHRLQASASELARRLDPRKAASVAFVDALDTGSMAFRSAGAVSVPDELAQEVFDDLTAKLAGLCADNALASPKEFWLVFGLCWKAFLHLAAGSRGFVAVTGLLSEVAAGMARREPYVSLALLEDFALPKMTALLVEAETQAAAAHKIPAVMRVLAAHVSAGGESDLLKAVEALQRALGPQRLGPFLDCLTSLLQQQTPNSTATAAAGDSDQKAAAAKASKSPLLSLYLFCADQGLADASPRLRASALGLLAALAGSRDTSVRTREQLLAHYGDRLEALGRADKAWQVRAQCCNMAGAFLAVLPAAHPRAAGLLALLALLLGFRQQADGSAAVQFPVSDLVLEAGLVAAGRAMHEHVTLRPLFLTLVLQHDSVRERMLVGSSGAALAAAGSEEEDDDGEKKGGGVLHPSLSQREYLASSVSELLPSVPRVWRVWHALTVLQLIEADVKAKALENLSTAHAQLLAAAVADSGPFLPAELAGWERSFEALRDFVVVEFYDPQLCAYVTSILRRFLLDPATQAVALQVLVARESGAVPALFTIAKLVFADGSDVSRRCLAAFLHELAAQPQPFNDSQAGNAADFPLLVYRFLDSLATFEKSLFEGSLLEPLRARIAHDHPGVAQ